MVSGDEHRGFACKVEVEDEGALTVSSGELLISGDLPQLDLHGTLTVDSLSLGNHGKFTLASTGKLVVNTLKLQAWSETSVALTGMIGNDGSKITFGDFEIGYEASITFDHSELNIETSSFKMDSQSKLILKGANKKISITSTDFVMQDDAEINVSEGGLLTLGTGSASGLEGASYGGEGGDNQEAGTYGSSVNPEDYGSGTSDVRGGGIFKLDVSNSANIDGLILANGKDSATTGGGSGGSINIRAAVLTGHGNISANGASSSSGGGGGGGRISLISSGSLSGFLGVASSYGGEGSAYGAAGTVYQEYAQSGGSLVKKIVVDNNGQVSDAYTYISGVTELSELEVNGYSQVKFEGIADTVKIDTITGDYTGTLKVMDNQVFEIATSYGTLTPYGLMCKLVIEENGKSTIPAKILLTDDDSTGLDWKNLEVYGTIIGVREMVVSSGGKALIHSTSRSGFTADNLQETGSLSLNKLSVTTDGLLEIGLDTINKYSLNIIQEITVKYRGTLTGRNLFIKTPTAEVAYGGELNVDGGNMELGEGPGRSGVNGAGGSFGGAGGASSDNVMPSVNYTRHFTSFYENLGSSGGSGNLEIGANGGGYLGLEVKTLTLHGTLRADGSSASVDGGGGSGGGIYILVDGGMYGSGSISVKGGSANAGGGGGGGRIYVYTSGNFHFLGDYILCGGSSSTGQAGGSGTAFTAFQQGGIPGYLQYLYFDNACATGAAEGITFIDTPGSDLMQVDNMIIGDNTKVWVNTEGLHAKAKTLTCGTGSMIVVDDNVIFSADTDQTYSAIACSFDLKQYGELRLASSVEMKGEESKLEGR